MFPKPAFLQAEVHSVPLASPHRSAPAQTILVASNGHAAVDQYTSSSSVVNKKLSKAEHCVPDAVY